MKTQTLLIWAIWALVVGGNVVNTFTIPSRTFEGAPQLPGAIAILPFVVIIGALITRGTPGERAFGHAIDHRFGLGTYQRFVWSLQPELMFSAMCFCIVLSDFIRLALFRTAALPSSILGFFASGCVAFLVAWYIRKRREAR